MSGTSMDGVDGVLASFPDNGPPQLLASASQGFDAALRTELAALNRAGDNELERAALAARGLVAVYAKVVAMLVVRGQVDASQVRAIGAHGQTVRHRPEAGFTIQLNAPAELAELTGIAVIADFRSRDVAAGGHGAPLVPAFHHALFGGTRSRAILNLGGIANVSLLIPGKPVTGFDTGPANLFMDMWCERHTGAAFDADGALASQGQVSEGLLDYLIDSEPWFSLAPPKSTGRDRFHAAWMDQRLQDWQKNHETLSVADIQATLRSLTARTVADAVRLHAPGVEEMLVCGGGAYNRALVADLAARLGIPVQATDAVGVPANEMEALAFAWLAAMHVAGRPGNLPAVTGARGLRILGAYHPA
ncbi:anhydro-N-acetylmuramic acid kinase [Pigmentiphaga aceris]|uniref:Anhydro-N-acetylmuramic acid kinase n=2 Tax=Pigmentiphaga aceris TaxID=1940612 RepID=A0A5C0B8H2_9BURK|nr:anhydro-N-acetylmuramic acid kinase [Pigmentiphaga aceris]